LNRDEFETYITEIKPNRDYAQIITQIGPDQSAKTLIDIIEKLGVPTIDIRYLSKEIILLVLGVKDMRDIILKLTESGFSKVSGYNALSFERPRANR
jgi:hypothetical protein